MRKVLGVGVGVLLAAGTIPAFAAGGRGPVVSDRSVRPAAIERAPDAVARRVRPRPDATPTARPTERPTTRPTDAPDRREELRLHCEGVSRGDTSGIACTWSASRHPRFAGYRLLRDREVVFRTHDRAATAHLDEAVRPGQVYVYLVEVVDADGNVIGSGGPVRAKAPEDRREELRMACRGVREAAIACTWSASQHRGFAGYRLWRGGPGDRREVVFATRSREETSYVDRGLEPGAVYVYLVEVLDADGNVIGSGGPVRATAGSDEPSVRPVPERSPDVTGVRPAAIDGRRAGGR